MESPANLWNEWLLPLVTVISFASLTVVFIKPHINVFLSRLRFRRRRTSGASTPPRSFSPTLQNSNIGDKKDPLPSVISSPDYVKTFPPSRRSALLELVSSERPDIEIGPEPSLDALQDNALPTTYTHDLDGNTTKYTPTGFSLAEVKALGDFPAYDVLSGVPLPQPYQNFDPERALPRPYRPFRWSYHQTMGNILSHVAVSRLVLTWE